MTRDELEAVIWEETHRLSQRNPRTVRTGAMDRVLSAADAYAAATVGEFAARGVPRVHLLAGGGYLACRPLAAFVMRATATTGDPAEVTCGGCKRTGAYREAAA